MINLIKFLISALKNKKKNTKRFKWTNEILIMKRFHKLQPNISISTEFTTV